VPTHPQAVIVISYRDDVSLGLRLILASGGTDEIMECQTLFFLFMLELNAHATGDGTATAQ
jgi:hypothetical protein